MNHPLPVPCPSEAAIARWISGGISSLTHPILAHIMTKCFIPLGIEADWLEAEPFSSLESGLRDGWLRSPRWNPALIRPDHPAAADLTAWTARAGEVTVQNDGILRFPASSDSDPDPWHAIRHSVAARERASAFLCAAAGSLLFDPAAAAIYGGGDDAGFARTIWARIDAAKTDRATPESATEHTTDGAAAA